LQFSNASRQSQQSQRNSLRSKLIQQLRTLFIKLTAQSTAQQRIRVDRRAGRPCHAPDLSTIVEKRKIAYLAILAEAVTQAAEELRFMKP
jgi:hypothetical protein